MSNDKIYKILEVSRWSPSAENEQPWTFRMEGGNQVIIASRCRHSNIAFKDDLSPYAISLGALLETISLASPLFGMYADINYDSTNDPGRFVVTFREGAEDAVDPLAQMIKIRQTDRGWFKPFSLRPADKMALENAVGPGYEIRWLGQNNKIKISRMNTWLERIRLFSPEIVQMYRHSIEWRTNTSDSRLPSGAIGLSPLSRLIFSIIIDKPRLYEIFMKYCGGALFAQIEVDILPQLMSSGDVVILRKESPRVFYDFVEAGRAVQRFWLTAASLEIAHHPNYLALVMSRYAREGKTFSVNLESLAWASRARKIMEGVIGSDSDLERAVWWGRIGYAKPASSRSLRLPLVDLIES